jgi:hypothetical protein
MCIQKVLPADRLKFVAFFSWPFEQLPCV